MGGLSPLGISRGHLDTSVVLKKYMVFEYWEVLTQ